MPHTTAAHFTSDRHCRIFVTPVVSLKLILPDRDEFPRHLVGRDIVADFLVGVGVGGLALVCHLPRHLPFAGLKSPSSFQCPYPRCLHDLLCSANIWQARLIITPKSLPSEAVFGATLKRRVYSAIFVLSHFPCMTEPCTSALQIQAGLEITPQPLPKLSLVPPVQIWAPASWASFWLAPA